MKYVMLFLIFISLDVNAALKSLNITTSIDLERLYESSINSVEFIPSILVLKSSRDKRKFDDVKTTLKIATDIPQEVSDIGYITTLVKNISSCTDYSGVINVQDDFVDIVIGGEEIQEGGTIKFSDFNSTDGTYKSSEHDVELIFKPFDSIKTAGQPEKCNGEVEFSIEVDI
ncbi:conserved exported hypothetical protein [Vibrio chagasii]|uniref:hypothetical protein n=1 Tax=Vibrio TaxID=662 RepID=UPI000E32AFA5|nr:MULTISPECIES: hypothetical protein [Vibrio]MCG9561352.1 hypothetical protein [Vibrio chagasii]MCG9673667.1 hypothetical protein [Vibrio chagasii]CAH6938857.1 conserved exported hypothetical protein [Vibrio chagasii]CAH6954297.1 conserved exported hypothetical protein [Vibrio chagasii]CAH6989763.1 conserved exported hypothetical protein [Vibrio chagasii]